MKRNVKYNAPHRLRLKRYSCAPSSLQHGKAIIFIVVGLLMLQHFLWTVIIGGKNEHYLTLLSFISITGFIIGSIMFFFGLITIIVGHTYNSTSSTTDLDIGRIRYTVETKKIEGK